MKIIVAHPSKQHSFYSCISLQTNGHLYKYITTVYDRKGSLTRKIKRLFKGNLRKKITSHYCDELDDSMVIQYCEFSYIVSLFLNRFPHLALLREVHRQQIANIFGRRVAKYAIKNKVDAVIMYDSTADSCFRVLKKKAPNIKRLLDVSIVARPYMKEEFEKDIENTGDDTIKRDNIILWNERLMKCFYSEIENATDFIVPSNIVQESLIYCGADKKNIRMVPYGVNIENFFAKEQYNENDTLNLIYVGQVTHRKGIHHLLKVIEKLNNDKINVDLVGTYSKNDNIYFNYHDKFNVKFHGFVTRDTLAEYYRKADVFVFPTLGEGYGLVVLEAMSCGLPVISSNHAGGNDPIVNGYNGFVFPAGNDDELEKCIQYMLDNKDQIKKMGINARKTSESLSWERYYCDYSRNIEELVKL